jgi:(1->4)-alpha-D-glucan 1-alpha-D-glucosylmutase
VLSEIPAEWEKNLRSWSRINRSKKVTVRGAEAPDRNDEYFLYQTLIRAPTRRTSRTMRSLKSGLTGYLDQSGQRGEGSHGMVATGLRPYEKAFSDFARQVLARGESHRS